MGALAFILIAALGVVLAVPQLREAALNAFVGLVEDLTGRA